MQTHPSVGWPVHPVQREHVQDALDVGPAQRGSQHPDPPGHRRFGPPLGPASAAETAVMTFGVRSTARRAPIRSWVRNLTTDRYPDNVEGRQSWSAASHSCSNRRIGDARPRSAGGSHQLGFRSPPGPGGFGRCAAAMNRDRPIPRPTSHQVRAQRHPNLPDARPALPHRATTPCLPHPSSVEVAF